MARSRRRGRELALRGLYAMDIMRVNPDKVLEDAVQDREVSAEQTEYAERVVRGYHSHSRYIDETLAERIKEYDFKRIAAIDRNILRIAAYELFFEPAIPPAVTLNEAIEIAKKYSTAESGKFVNGVLGRVLADSEKAHWDPATAPLEEEPEEILHTDEAPEIEEVDVEAGSAQEKDLARIAGWKLRSDNED